MEKNIAKWSFFLALGEAIYIFLVAFFMFNAQRIFGNEPGVFGVIAFLMLFVISAAVSGALVLGKPTLLYLEGKRGSALALFASIMGWMILFFGLTLLFISNTGI